MTYVTIDQAVAASRRAFGNRTLAKSQMTKFAAASMNTDYDVFLSHSFEDAEMIAGAKVLLEDEGLKVYVDWVDDAETDRSDVTPETANMLRSRMKHCRFLLYASSVASRKSKWMPWELGYFDGMKPQHVGVMPILRSAMDGFDGQEYLGLYPIFEILNFSIEGRHIGRMTGPDEAKTLVKVARGL